MNQSIAEVKIYYDGEVSGKLRGFIEENPRVERAWLTIEKWAANNPQRILEIGCGIGNISWRMSRYWPEAEVVGLDISPKSLEIATKLFGSSKLSFIQGPLVTGTLTGNFDLIVLMDVYEHIAIADRPILHQALKELRSDGARIVLAFPTPRHLAWLRKYDPDKIQPIDEDVNNETILKLATDTNTEVLLYQEVDIWHQGDYAHAVLGNREGWIPATNYHSKPRGIKSMIRQLLGKKNTPLVPPKKQRLALVRQKLGGELSL